MGTYIPGTEAEQREMLRETGLRDMDDLFDAIPETLRMKGGPDLPPGLSELEVSRRMKELAKKNRVFETVFRGAGAYRHYIPAVVREVASREEFTAVYTPYQPEINQGILQALFEFQTMICELTGMDAANNSMYDGATAAAEALLMCPDRRKKTLFVSETVDPKVRAVIDTYCGGRDVDLRLVPAAAGVTDLRAMKEMLTAEDASPAGVYIQHPNYFGLLEPVEECASLAHEAGALLAAGVNPISLGILPPPGEWGADIAVGEGQPLGLDLAFGGPYFGFFAVKSNLLRRMPGKIAGQTEDDQGRRAFALTLQAREQHIRREKAGSNICTNQAHCAVRASVYMAAMGPDGLAEAASQCVSKAHYFARKLTEAGLSLKYRGEFFHEFVTVCEKDRAERILVSLEEQGILGGLPLGNGEILWCATEMNTVEEMDRAAEIAGEVRNETDF